MRHAVLTLIVLVLLGIAAGAAVIYGGLYNVAATAPHLPIVRWALDTTFENAVRRLAEDGAPAGAAPVPDKEAARLYANLCVQCHGGPGVEQPTMAQHMRPQPPALAEVADHWTVGEIHWIASNGVKMTGMPAFGPWHTDEQLWALAAFVRQLPDMAPDAYQAQIAPPEQAGAAGETAEEDGAPGATVQMTSALKFEPRRVVIAAGERIVWKNTSDMQHTATADPKLARDKAHVHLPEGAETFNSGMVEPGQSYERRFTVPGSYTYFCIPHEAAGMIGEIVVEPRQ